MKIEIKVEYLHDFPTDEWRQVHEIENAVRRLILSHGFERGMEGGGRGKHVQVFVTKGDKLS
jgi:hypothetical protein